MKTVGEGLNRQWMQLSTRGNNIASVKVGPFKYLARKSSKFKFKGREFFGEIKRFKLLRNRCADWLRAVSAQKRKKSLASDWLRESKKILEGLSFDFVQVSKSVEEKLYYEVVLAKLEVKTKSTGVPSAFGPSPNHCKSVSKSPSDCRPFHVEFAFLKSVQGNLITINVVYEYLIEGFDRLGIEMSGKGGSKPSLGARDFLATGSGQSGPPVTAPKQRKPLATRPTNPPAGTKRGQIEGQHANSSTKATNEAEKQGRRPVNANPQQEVQEVENAVEGQEVVAQPAKAEEEAPILSMAAALKMKKILDEMSSDEEDMFADSDEALNEKVLFDQFGLNLEQKQRIFTLLATNVLVLSPDIGNEPQISAEDLSTVMEMKKTYTIRLRFENIGANEYEEAARPGNDVIEEFLFLEEGLGIPAECLAQTYGVFNLDSKPRTVQDQEGKDVVFENGLSQFWEVKLVTWIPLHLELLVGKKKFGFGTGRDKWRILLPGGKKEKDDTPTFYCRGICEDPTIKNEDIASKLTDLAFDVQGGRRGVKTSGGPGSKLQSNGRYFFSKTQFQKNSEGNYEKIRIGIYSRSLKKVVKISFAIMDEDMRKEAENKVVNKCFACGQTDPKCSGTDGRYCSWKEVSIDDHKAKLEKLNKLNSMVVGATAVAPEKAMDEQKMLEDTVKYMRRLEKDNDEERVWRIRTFAAHTMKVEAEKAKKGKKEMDEDGFTEVGKAKARKLKFTLHQPFQFNVIKMISKYDNNLANKDRLIATIYRWPSKDHDFDRKKALLNDLNPGQIHDLALKAGIIASKAKDVIDEMEKIVDKKAKAERLVQWMDNYVTANEATICKETASK